MRRGLEIVRWAFWSPEARAPAAWREHWRSPTARPSEREVPDEAIPAAHRRRMSALSRLAVQIAIEATGDAVPGYLVFGSQHGDLTRLQEMLRDIAAGTELSPTSFSQSVHNASAGLYTIVRSSNAPVSSLASGASTFASAWIEAEALLLADPQSQVLLVCYDEPLPPEYAPYSSQRQCFYALGLLLRIADNGGIALEPVPAEQDEPLPMAPLFAAWALSGEPALRFTAEGRGWMWRRA